MNEAFVTSGRNEKPWIPKWMRGASVCPVLRGKEVWWRTSGLFVKGIPPSGLRYSHHDPHIVPEDFGPVGDPIQVTPRFMEYDKIVTMADNFGETRCRIDSNDVRFLMGWSDNATLRFFFYPEVEDGKPQYIGCFKCWRKIETARMEEIQQRLMRGEGVDPNEELEDYFELFAIISPVIHRLDYLLSLDQIATVPRFSGTQRPEDDLEHLA